MPALELPLIKRHAATIFRRPHNLVVNRSHQHAKYLALLDPMTDGVNRDIVGNRHGVLSGGMRAAFDRIGPFVRADGVNDSLGYGFTPPNSAVGLTLFGIVNSRGAVNIVPINTRTGTAAANTGVTLACGVGGNATTWQFNMGDGTTTTNGQVSGLENASHWHAFVGVHRPGGGSGSTQLSIVNEAGKYYSGTNTTNLAAFNHGQELLIGKRGANFFAGDVALVGWLNFCLESRHHRSLARDIWQLVRSASPRRYWFSTVTSITPDPLTQAQTLGEPPLTQAHVLVVQALTQAQTLESPSLTQHNLLTPDALVQLQQLAAAGLTEHNLLAVHGLTQQQALEVVALTQHNALAVDSLTHAQLLDPPGLTQHAVLIVDSLTQAQILEVVTLGGVVVGVGALSGKLVMYTLLDGQLVMRELLQGSAQSAPALAGMATTFAALDTSLDTSPALAGSVAITTGA